MSIPYEVKLRHGGVRGLASLGSCESFHNEGREGNVKTCVDEASTAVRVFHSFHK